MVGCFCTKLKREERGPESLRCLTLRLATAFPIPFPADTCAGLLSPPTKRVSTTFTKRQKRGCALLALRTITLSERHLPGTSRFSSPTRIPRFDLLSWQTSRAWCFLYTALRTRLLPTST